MSGVAHWDEVELHRRAKGEMDATWQRLGDAAGTAGVGLNRVRVLTSTLEDTYLEAVGGETA